MSFDTLMRQADDVLWSTGVFGVAGTYQPMIGDPVAITIIVSDTVEPRPEDGEYRINIDTVELHIRMVDVAQPKRGDTFTTDTHVYTVDHTSRSDGLVNIVRARKASV